MQYSLEQYLLLAVFTFVLVGALTPVMRRVAIRIGAFDTPNIPRKQHNQPVPYLGGIAIALGILIASYGALLYSDFSMRTFTLASSVLLPAMAMSIMGLIDDLRGLEPWPRLVIQVASAFIVAVILISTNTIGTALNINFLDGLITIFWIVGVCNSINFFDNLDGGASGTVAIISFFTFLIAYNRGQILVSALAIVTAGATAGFLLWNRAPAKIYMGDAGALFLGIIVAVLTIRLDPGMPSRTQSLAVPFLLMALPIMDTMVAVGSRLIRGISPFQGGRDHLSHRLIRLGLNREVTAVLLWSAAAFFGLLSYLICIRPENLGYPLVIFGGVLWTSLLIFFCRVASEDK